MKRKILICVFVLAISIIGCGKAEETASTGNVVNEDIDGADTLTEVEGGDGEDVTEAESTESSTEASETQAEETPAETVTNEFNVTDCTPTTKYTNTSANIRAIPDKAGDLINTVSINTELTVTGTTDTGWSRIENSGVVCFIKSSLLSDTKTEIKQSSSSTGGTSAPSQPSAPSGGGAAAGSPPSREGGTKSVGDVPVTGSLTGESQGGLGGGY